jgi:hypothetical protein
VGIEPSGVPAVHDALQVGMLLGCGGGGMTAVSLNRRSSLPRDRPVVTDPAATGRLGGYCPSASLVISCCSSKYDLASAASCSSTMNDVSA